MKENLKFGDLTKKIIGCAFEVHSRPLKSFFSMW